MHYMRRNLALRIGMGIIILVTNKVQNIMTCTILSPLSVKPDRNCQCSLDIPPPQMQAVADLSYEFLFLGKEKIAPTYRPIPSQIYCYVPVIGIYLIYMC